MAEHDENPSAGRRAFLGAASGLSAAAVTSPLRAEEPELDHDEWRTVRARSSSIRPWMMPAHFGMPDWQISDANVPQRDSLYDDVTIISISYLTDAEKLVNYLPIPFELEGPPIIKVAYSMNRKISWLAGGSYNIISVTTPAKYPGKKDSVSGEFALVLWENLTEPILPGREQQGIPKVFGNIEDHREHNGTWSTALSNNGKTMLNIEASDLQEITGSELEEFKKANEKVNLLGWKYIPNETRSKAILSYATIFPFAYDFRSVSNAKGTLEWFSCDWTELPTQAHIVNALHALPIEEVVDCKISQTRLVLRTSQVRRLT